MVGNMVILLIIGDEVQWFSQCILLNVCAEGSWALSMREGEGEETWKNGDKYVGQFSRDKMHGLGKYQTLWTLVV